VSPLASDVGANVLTDVELYEMNQRPRGGAASPLAWGPDETKRRASLFARSAPDPAPLRGAALPWHLIPDTDVGFDDEIRDDYGTYAGGPPDPLHAEVLERYQGSRQGVKRDR
jgi:hypothetical protein